MQKKITFMVITLMVITPMVIHHVVRGKDVAATHSKLNNWDISTPDAPDGSIIIEGAYSAPIPDSMNQICQLKKKNIQKHLKKGEVMDGPQLLEFYWDGSNVRKINENKWWSWFWSDTGIQTADDSTKNAVKEFALMDGLEGKKVYIQVLYVNLPGGKKLDHAWHAMRNDRNEYYRTAFLYVMDGPQDPLAPDIDCTLNECETPDESLVWNPSQVGCDRVTVISNHMTMYTEVYRDIHPVYEGKYLGWLRYKNLSGQGKFIFMYDEKEAWWNDYNTKKYKQTNNKY